MAGLARHILPQIPSNKLDGFCVFLSNNGVKSKKMDVAPTKLKPIQKEYKREKVDKIKDTFDYQTIPLIVSKEGYILDGHHRWIAAVENKDETIPIIFCDVPMKKLIFLGHEYEPSFTKTVNEILI